MFRSSDPREALADQFYRSQVCRDLQARIDWLNSTDPHEKARLADQRRALQVELAERCWLACNPGNTGRFRIGLRCADGTVRPLDECPSYNTPRFNSRREALNWIAAQTDVAPEKLGVRDCGEPEREQVAA